LRFKNGSKLIDMKYITKVLKLNTKAMRMQIEGLQLLRTQTKNSSKHNPVAKNNSHQYQEVETHVL
jgi:hypothetical protein